MDRRMTMPDLNLKPCPFCGGAADFCLNNEWFNGCYRKLFIKCLKCGATGKPILMAASRWCPGLNGGRFTHDVGSERNSGCALEPLYPVIREEDKH